MIGSHSTGTKESKRLTTAGLIAVTAATLLMMAWAIFPTAAFADGTVHWNGTNGWPPKLEGGGSANNCLGGGHWVLTAAQGVTGATLIVNGVSYPMSQSGNGSWSADSGPFDINIKPTASVEYTGTATGNINLTLSHCTEGETTTTTTPPEETTTTTPPEETTTTTPPEETTTTTPPEETTTTTPPEETTTTTPPEETTTTTTPGGGGGGGGGTTTAPVTTTTTPTVGPTTVEPSSTTTKSPNVAPTTVSPRGTAFTGVENVVPIGAIALMLMTSGTGLLWAGSRRKRDQNQDEE
jgi:hypothetical protein